MVLQRRRSLARALLFVTALLFAWALLLALTGGFRVEWGPIRISSRTPDTPFVLGLTTAGILLAELLRKSLAGWPAQAAATAPSPAGRSRRATGAWLVRGFVVAAATFWYFGRVFDVRSGLFLKSGLETWLDAYFINYLQEHWLTSVLRFADPASPPMYYPVEGTLGYSHGLVLFAPFYAAARLVLDPFPADTVALFVIMTGGSIALYLAFRRVLRLSFVESLLLSAFFFTGANVINIGTGQWTQRASVFFISGIVLLGARALSTPERGRSVAAAAAAGLLSTLLLTQDAYTALLAALFMGLLGLPVLAAPSGRPARAWLGRVARSPVGLAFSLGAYLGLLVFLWCYTPSLIEHRSFSADHLAKALMSRDPTSWGTPVEAWRDLQAYDTPRTFYLATGLVAAAWLPGSRASGSTRLFMVWFLAVSAMTLVVPFSFNGFSPWQTVFAPLPGLAVIRDPKRIIYLYELAAVAVAGWYLSRLPARSPSRWLVVGLAALLLATHWNPNMFRYRRSVAAFDSWVAAPIAIDPGCRSFFMKAASADYMGRTGDMWGLYNIDAMFIASRTGIPTLNGYSAFEPRYWGLARPQESGYLSAVDNWIGLHNLHDVCALDIDARTMTPYVPAVTDPAGVSPPGTD